MNAFVGPARDFGHDSVLARIYPMLLMARRACPWASPECLPLFLQFLFSPSYLVLKGQGINLTAQHLLPTSKSDSAVQIESEPDRAVCSGNVLGFYGYLLSTRFSASQVGPTLFLQHHGPVFEAAAQYVSSK